MFPSTQLIQLVTGSDNLPRISSSLSDKIKKLNSSTGASWTNISNATGAAVWLQDAGNFIHGSYAGGLVAVGTNRGNSLALTAQVNRVITAASAAVGVTLPASATVGVGGACRVYNDGPSNAFHIYAAGSDTIDGAAGTTGVSLTNAFYCDFLVDTAGAFLSFRTAFARST